MVATPLNSTQLQAIGMLVAAGRVDHVPVDDAKAGAFMTSATRLLDQVALLDYPEAQHTLAYNACHSVAEAILAAYGYRTKSGQGQHEALGRFLCAVIDNPPSDVAAKMFDRIRHARNQQDYRAVPVGAAQAALATATAQELHDAAVRLGIT